MAKVKRTVDVPKVETREVEVEVDDNDPSLVHERFEKAHADNDAPIFTASALRKVAQHLHNGRSVQRALEMAAEEIENIVTGARARIEDAGVEADHAQLPEEEERALRERWAREGTRGETFDAFRDRIIAADDRYADFRPRPLNERQRAETEAQRHARG